MQIVQIKMLDYKHFLYGDYGQNYMTNNSFFNIHAFNKFTNSVGYLMEYKEYKIAFVDINKAYVVTPDNEDITYMVSKITSDFNSQLDINQKGKLFTAKVVFRGELDECLNSFLNFQRRTTSQSIDIIYAKIFGHAPKKSSEKLLDINKEINYAELPAFFKRGVVLTNHYGIQKINCPSLTRNPNAIAQMYNDEYQYVNTYIND